MAIGQIGFPYGAPWLRVKARVGAVAPAVVGNCLVALLALEAPGCIEFVAGFLDADPDLQVEAAAALAVARAPASIGALTKLCPRERSFELRRTIVTSLGASTIPEAADFLLEVVAEPDQELATAALESLAASRFTTKCRDWAEATVTVRGSEALRSAFQRHFDDVTL